MIGHAMDQGTNAPIGLSEVYFAACMLTAKRLEVVAAPSCIGASCVGKMPQEDLHLSARLLAVPRQTVTAKQYPYGLPIVMSGISPVKKRLCRRVFTCLEYHNFGVGLSFI